MISKSKLDFKFFSPCWNWCVGLIDFLTLHGEIVEEISLRIEEHLYIFFFPKRTPGVWFFQFVYYNLYLYYGIVLYLWIYTVQIGPQIWPIVIHPLTPFVARAY